MSKEQVFYRSKYISGIDPYDKKETLEEIEIISKQRIHKYNPMKPHPTSFFIGFKAGVEWQQEQIEKLKDFDTWKEWKNKSE